MKPILPYLLFLIALNISAQQIDTELKSRLDSIMHKDQELRKLFSPVSKEEKEGILEKLGYTWVEFDQKGWEMVAEQDSLHLKQIDHIISRYGYPGRSLVGTPTNRAAWLVIQHSNQIDHYFPIVQKAGKEKEIPMTLVATMEDRMLMYKGSEQKYGTQLKSGVIKDPETGERKWQFYIWPIQSPEKVNELRKNIGFETTIQEYANSRKIDYKPLSLEDVKRPGKK